MRLLTQLAAATLIASAANAQWKTMSGGGIRDGNLNSGFGGVIGTGTIEVLTLSDGSVSLTINRGTAEFNDAAIIYIDSLAGGVTNTSMLTDTGDPGRAGISGNGFGGQTSDLAFGSDFVPDFAISYQTGFAGLFGIGADPANHAFVAAVGGGTSPADASFAMTFNLADIGLVPGDSFGFLITYLNNTNAYRSGEFIGMGVNSGFPDGDNIGNNAYSLGEDAYILVNSVPTPASAALLGLGGLAAARRRR